VVEAGCKTVIGQRAKQSGMKWTEAGLLNVLAMVDAFEIAAGRKE
jgi:hypothetical protein